MRTPSRPSMLLLLALPACDCGSPSGSSLAQNVGESFATCNAREIEFLAAKHNIQLAFRPCGNNNFSAYRWSPDGLRLYFHLVLSSYVMDADAANKQTTNLPITTPTGEGAWLTATRLVVPVAGEEDAPPRMAVLDLPPLDAEDGMVSATELGFRDLGGLVEPGQLQRGEDPSEVLFTARKTKDGPVDVFRLDLDDGTVGRAFDWLEPPVDTFTYQPGHDRVLLGKGDTVTMTATDGTAIDSWDHARRGSLDPTGRWLLLELEGAPVSIYYQRSWDEVSEQARRREEARAKRFGEQLPAWYPKETRPPTLSLVDLASKERWTFSAFLGDHFQWYEAADGWGAFFFWGFEGKQFKRNVALVNLNDRLRAIGEGREMLGVHRFEAPPPKSPEVDAP